MEEKDSLAVYYGKNFWTAPQGAPAQAVPVDWQFTWAGHLCRIPALYVSDAGLTLDVLLFLDSGAVRTFCKKYAGVDGERLTPLEERMLEGERPIPEASFSPRLINGLPVEPCASSSFTWVPFVRRERPDAAVDAVRRLRFPVPAGRLLCVPPCARPLAPRDADRCKKPVTGGRRRAAVDARRPRIRRQRSERCRLCGSFRTPGYRRKAHALCK